MRVLVTRAADQAEATAARLEALGHTAVVAPLTRLVFDAEIELPLAGTAALVVTSANALAALKGRTDLDALRALPLFAVGRRTAAAARDLGFATVVSADGDRDDLARLICANLSVDAGALLWLAGRDRTPGFAETLAERGFRVVEREIYRSEEIGEFPPETAAALARGEIDAIAVYSPRSASLIVAAWTACGFSPTSSGLAIHAISEAAARPFREIGATTIVAARPEESALLATLAPPDAGGA